MDDIWHDLLDMSPLPTCQRRAGEGKYNSWVGLLGWAVNVTNIWVFNRHDARPLCCQHLPIPDSQLEPYLSRPRLMSKAVYFIEMIKCQREFPHAKQSQGEISADEFTTKSTRNITKVYSTTTSSK